MRIAAVAFSAGFRSVRQFNHAVRATFKLSPRALRNKRRVAPSPSAPLTIRLPYRPPLDWHSLLQFFAARVTPGVEAVRDGRYQRTVALAMRSARSPSKRLQTPRAADARALPESAALLEWSSACGVSISTPTRCRSTSTSSAAPC
jgi:hypothetical protein